MKPIYIPSRHRPECPTAQMLDLHDIPFKVVIEPHDAANYFEWEDRLEILPEDNRGIGYARSIIKATSTEKGEDFHWQIDDDATGFILRHQGCPSAKLHAKDAMGSVEAIMHEYANVAIAGFNQNSWPPKGSLIWNDLPVQGVLINNACPFTYRHDLPIMSDFDFVLQCLKAGWATALLDHIRIITPAIGSNQGGLNHVYASTDRKRESARRLQEYWPGLNIIFKEDGGMTIQKKKFMNSFDPPRPRSLKR